MLRDSGEVKRPAASEGTQPEPRMAGQALDPVPRGSAGAPWAGHRAGDSGWSQDAQVP